MTSRIDLGKKVRAEAGGFSLVEVVLALGVVALAFVSILGLLPVGLNTFRMAMDTSVTSQIVQRVTNEAQETDYDQLADFIRYFDDQGNLVAAGANQRIYDVRVVVRKGTALPAQAQSPNLATLTVQIANNPGRQTVGQNGGTGLWVTTPQVTVRNFPALVARSRAQ